MFADQLIEARQSQNKSVNSMASKLGVKGTLYWKWEKGTALPSRRNMDKIHTILSIPYEQWAQEKRDKGQECYDLTGYCKDFDNNKLISIMEEKKMNRKELAKALDCSVASVSNWIKGKTPTYRFVYKLNDVFEVDLDYWLEQEKPEEEKTFYERCKDVAKENLEKAANEYEEVTNRNPEDYIQDLVNRAVENKQLNKDDNVKDNNEVVKQLKVMNSTLKSIQSMISGLIVQLDQ